MPYYYRNAICPWCGHAFTVLLDGDNSGYAYYDRAAKQYIHPANCPSCGKEMILVPDKAEGNAEKFLYSPERYEGTRGI